MKRNSDRNSISSNERIKFYPSPFTSPPFSCFGLSFGIRKRKYILWKFMKLYLPEPKSVWLRQEHMLFGHGLQRVVQRSVSQHEGLLINVNICIHRSIWVLLPKKSSGQGKHERKRWKLKRTFFSLRKSLFYLFPVSHWTSS